MGGEPYRYTTDHFALAVTAIAQIGSAAERAFWTYIRMPKHFENLALYIYMPCPRLNHKVPKSRLENGLPAFQRPPLLVP